MYDDGWHPIRWSIFAVLLIFGIWGASIAFGIVSLPFHAVDATVQTAHGVIDRTMNADNALEQYRWFHDASSTLDSFPVKIKQADKLEKWTEIHAPDRASSRMTELTGIEQTCTQLVADYNSRASRLDSGFFRNPERWLPVSAAPWTPLPQSYNINWCNLNDEGVK
jgi:hypothetical protein